VKGYVAAGGIRIPVTEISLRESRLTLRCALAGPAQEFSGGAVTIFGEDGSGICQGYCDDLRWREVAEGEALEVTINMQMERCLGDAEMP